MPRTATREACSALLLLVSMFVVDTAAARSIRAYMFNLNPGHNYRVQLDGTDHTVPYSGAAGVADAVVDASDGSLVTFIDDGIPNLQPPAPPLFSSLDTGGPGCASAAWIPSGDPTVVGYVVSYGDDPGQYDRTVSASAASAEVCMLEKGMHYFAVQCRNYAGTLSAYSAERSVNIVVVAVLISQFDARVEEHGVRLSWRVEADENILSYRVYRAGADGVEYSITPEPIAPTTLSFLDDGARAGARYTYVVAAVNEAGDEIRSFPIDVETPALTLSLGQNAPNPFNPMTSIPFVLDASTRVMLRVYDVRGALVATLFDGVLGEGTHRIAWNGRNDAGRPVSSGTYLYSLVAGKHRLARKMLMVR